MSDEEKEVDDGIRSMIDDGSYVDDVEVCQMCSRRHPEAEGCKEKVFDGAIWSLSDEARSVVLVESHSNTLFLGVTDTVFLRGKVVSFSDASVRLNHAEVVRMASKMMRWALTHER